MKAVLDTDELRQLGTILSVWAHPDDESYTCGGIMAAASANGQQVVCVTATKGEDGVQDETRWPAAELGKVRAEELAAALNILGVHDHHWLEYRDGECANVSIEEGGERLRALIDRYKPDTIFTFGPDGWTGHPDHCAVSNWVDAATKGTDITIYHAVVDSDAYEQQLKRTDEKFNIFFNTDKPPLKKPDECDIHYTLSKEELDKKLEALKSMPSQTEKILKSISPEETEALLGQECFVRAK